jgi:hypothetical protein
MGGVRQGRRKYGQVHAQTQRQTTIRWGAGDVMPNVCRCRVDSQYPRCEIEGDDQGEGRSILPGPP